MAYKWNLLRQWMIFVVIGFVVLSSAVASASPAEPTDQSTSEMVSDGDSLPSPVGDSDPSVFGYYYVTVTGSDQFIGTEVLRRSSYEGPADVNITVSETMKASWSATVGISADIVSAGVGFDVEGYYTVTESYSTHVPSGYIVTITVYPKYHRVFFDVWYKPVIGDAYKVGSGSAKKLSGYHFSRSQTPIYSPPPTPVGTPAQ
ncbi:MAG: hypothetical protein KM310_11620 [Clostridiales bacterium]|nr:hypothetical protein [Clostridiales bacterium]